ncbi:DUF3054 domain-containing protein [Gordonia sp. HY002]|uniref:DUF3054 domain-containing protein n=1 Tax=Gordonia zhenghanii TaxID=2911516 RepID=UPI001EF0B602|nr:DUF3054 domain-containing protein [Gordonia zhenghanii]MCF8569255.1 DUF3054 domain-containing protein [Gordonia zhenghanii]MCF8605367.1 DUF3054 domain-containing protein [Gordonia zhenghanii]
MTSRDTTASHRTPAHRTSVGIVALAAVADIVAICVFVAIGRRNHDEAGTVSGFLTTGWPFLVGAFFGWCVTVVATGRRFAPGRLLPAGAVVWVSTVVVGMVLRVFADQGTATSFIVVASVATGILLLGWRSIAALVARRRS